MRTDILDILFCLDLRRSRFHGRATKALVVYNTQTPSEAPPFCAFSMLNVSEYPARSLISEDNTLG
jgi:hypothetical protein